MKQKTFLAFVAGLVLVASLPLLAETLRDDRTTRCAGDGVAIDTLHAVRVVTQTGAAGPTESPSLWFCCTGCADAWLARAAEPPRAVFVVDEDTGVEIDAEHAWFVRSLVVAVPETQNRVHVFATEAAARRHAEAFRGTVLEGTERPLRPTN